MAWKSRSPAVEFVLTDDSLSNLTLPGTYSNNQRSVVFRFETRI